MCSCSKKRNQKLNENLPNKIDVDLPQNGNKNEIQPLLIENKKIIQKKVKF